MKLFSKNILTKATLFLLVAIIGLSSCSDDNKNETPDPNPKFPTSVKDLAELNSTLKAYAEGTMEKEDGSPIIIAIENAITSNGEVILPTQITTKKAPSITINFASGIDKAAKVDFKSESYDGNIEFLSTEIEGALEANFPLSEVTLKGVFNKIIGKSKSINLSENSSINSLEVIAGDVQTKGLLNNVAILSENPMTIIVEAGGNFLGEYKDEQEKSTLVMGRVATTESSKWISKVLEFRPAPGQFINESIYHFQNGKQDYGWGFETSGNNIVGGKSLNTGGTGISLGAWGGYVVYQFDHSIINQEGYDFVIHQNARSAEPGIVQVSYDVNGNGLADDEWYEIQGSWHDDPSTIRDYKIVYENPNNLTDALDIDYTGNGIAGKYIANLFPNKNCPECGHAGHSHWATWIKDETIEFTGTLLDWKSMKADPEKKGITGYAKGGATGKDFSATLMEDVDTRESNKIDLDWAATLDGKKVNLKRVDFIRIYTGVIDYSTAATTGEISTEITGSLSLTPSLLK